MATSSGGDYELPTIVRPSIQTSEDAVDVGRAPSPSRSEPENGASLVELVLAPDGLLADEEGKVSSPRPMSPDGEALCGSETLLAGEEKALVADEVCSFHKPQLTQEPSL
jgi:hypothetical protein